MKEETMPGTAGAEGDTSRELDHEAVLVARARRLEHAAWTQIYEANYDKIYRYVYARVSTPETAEDLASTTFVEALKSIRSYEHRGRPLLAWLYRIARNVVNYHHRRRLRGPAGTPASLDAGERQERVELSDESSDPALLIDGIDVRKAIDHLSPDQRDAIILRYYVGLTTPEAAEVMGKNERAVYSLQARAIKALKRHIGS